jgi:superfamily II DNA or RNA helicase
MSADLVRGALRPYQSAALAATMDHWESGRRRVVCALPTGAGKTTVAAACLEAARARRPALALVHTRTLLAQTRRRLGPGVVVRTIQAVLRAGVRLEHDVVFLDECHHLASRSWVRVLSLLPPGVRIIGCTATPARADGAALGTDGAGFDALVSTAPYSTLLRLGHLAPCRVVRPPADTLSAAAAYLQFGERRPGILFAPSIAACETAATALRSAGVRAATITAATGARARRAAFAAYEAGALDVLASPMALSEGFDSPRAAVCVLDRTCVHHGVYLQTAGRILRPHASKDPLAGGRPAVLIDMHGASERHGHPLADRQYSLKGDPIRLEGPAAPAPAPARSDAPRLAARRQPSPARPRRAPVEQAGFRAGSALARAGSWVTSFFLFSMGAR